MGNSIPLGTDGLDGSSWRQPPAAQPMPNFVQSYALIPNNVQPNRTSRSSTKKSTLNSVYAVDGQDWYLEDSVNWQSGFDAWNIANGSSGTSGMPEPSMFMFTSNTSATNDVRRSSPITDFNFDSLNSLSNDVDGWGLTGLD